MISIMFLNKENLNRKNFKADEFFNSDIAYRLNHDADPTNDIINYPSKAIEQAILPCLMNTADMLQEAYDLLLEEFNFRQKRGYIKQNLKFYIRILSAYRCLPLNRLAKSKDNSQHVQGLAADIVSSFGTPEEIVKFLWSKRFLADQCFCEGGWLHISRKLVKNQNRMMFGYYLLDEKSNERKFKSL